MHSTARRDRATQWKSPCVHWSGPRSLVITATFDVCYTVCHEGMSCAGGLFNAVNFVKAECIHVHVSS